ncbi:MAG: hypothetical protein OEY34_09490, partial [Cyclobacteriaceae bacterium]|nr:hypothetical protein [Cyclobacteriaceae bacterium]
MRIKINLKSKAKDQVLPLNYNYEMASWIYNLIENGDYPFSMWLKSRGFNIKEQNHILYTFSQLKPKKFQIESDRIKILSEKSYFVLSIQAGGNPIDFIGQLLHQHEFSLGDKTSRALFSIDSFQTEPLPTFNNKMVFRTLSPIVLSKTCEKTGFVKYMNPLDDDYKDKILDNVVGKFTHVLNAGYKKIKDYNEELSFSIVSEPRSKLITLASGTGREVKVRGFMYDFA